MNTNKMAVEIDTINYHAIAWLEKLGNEKPSEEQINIMEYLLMRLGLVTGWPVQWDDLMHLTQA